MTEQLIAGQHAGESSESVRRVSVVTGGTRGLGRAISLSLAADGREVVAVYRSDYAAAHDLLATADRERLPITTLQSDVADPECCNAIARVVLERFGRIDHVINCAAVLRDGTLAELSTEDWDEVITGDLSSVFYVTRATYPPMRAQNFGRIVMIGSSGGLLGSTARPNYAAAKAGLIGLTRSVARDGAPKGVTANLIVVGPTEVGMGAPLASSEADPLVAQIPIRRRIRGEEIAHAVRFLVDDDAGAVTGSLVFVDGGFTR